MKTTELEQKLASVEHQIESLERRKENLKAQIATRYHPLDWERVVCIVGQEFGVDPAKIHSRRKLSAVADARQVAMAIIYRKHHASLNDVAKFFGCRCHGTVMHAVRMVRIKNEVDDGFRKNRERAMERIGKERGKY